MVIACAGGVCTLNVETDEIPAGIPIHRPSEAVPEPPRPSEAMTCKVQSAPGGTSVGVNEVTAALAVPKKPWQLAVHAYVRGSLSASVKLAATDVTSLTSTSDLVAVIEIAVGQWLRPMPMPIDPFGRRTLTSAVTVVVSPFSSAAEKVSVWIPSLAGAVQVVEDAAGFANMPAVAAI